jgi:hypothetical protein
VKSLRAELKRCARARKVSPAKAFSGAKPTEAILASVEEALKAMVKPLNC